MWVYRTQLEIALFFVTFGRELALIFKRCEFALAAWASAH
jgi:hypothetical protein